MVSKYNFKNLKIFLQNVCKNKILIDRILETNKDFDIIFIQEPSLMFIYTIPSSFNKNSNSLVEVSNHSNWITFSRSLNNNNKHSHVILYIKTCLSHIYFILRKDIFNYRDICCFYFFDDDNIFFMINLHSNDCQSALKYLKDTEVNIWNVLIMANDFNIRDSN